MKPDLVAALIFALRERPCGRRTLVRQAGAGESTVRTQLTKLKKRGWVAFAKAGTTLSASGRSAFAPLLETVRAVAFVELEEVELGALAYAAHLRNPSMQRSTLTLRDKAIQGGAQGALLLRYDAGFLFADSAERLTFSQASRALSKAFSTLQTGDMVWVAFAVQPEPAVRGLWRMVVEQVRLPFGSVQGAFDGGHLGRMP